MSKLSLSGILLSFCIVCTLGTLQSCKHDPFSPDVTDPGGNGSGTGTPCDPSTVYFETQILPILQSNCAMSGCHNEASHQEGIILTSYSRVIQSGNIKAGKASDSKLYKVLIDNDPDDIMPPRPAQPLSSSQIALIAGWINQGAKNLTCDDNTGVCNTDNMSFAQHIRPILQTYCVGCHSGAAPGGGINLSAYSGAAASVPNGRLYGSINHLTGYKAMPQGGNKIPECNILKIKSWIDAGALNN